MNGKKPLPPVAGHRFSCYDGSGGSIYRPRLDVDTSGTRIMYFSDVKNRGNPAYGQSSPDPVSTFFRKRERSPIRAPFEGGEMKSGMTCYSWIHIGWNYPSERVIIYSRFWCIAGYMVSRIIVSVFLWETMNILRQLPECIIILKKSKALLLTFD